MSRRPPNAPLTSAPGKSREAHPLHKRLSSAGPSQHPPVALRPTMAKIDGIRVLRADEVDEDSDLEDKHHTAIYGGQSISRPASGEPKSGTVSRTTSLERGAGSALQHIRLSRRNSEAGADGAAVAARPIQRAGQALAASYCGRDVVEEDAWKGLEQSGCMAERDVGVQHAHASLSTCMAAVLLPAATSSRANDPQVRLQGHPKGPYAPSSRRC